MKKTRPEEVSPALLAYLQGFMLPERIARFESVLTERTRYLTCVLENISDSHNSNAVMRSCECFGIQDVYVIDNGVKYKPARKVLKGSHKWLSIRKYYGEGDNSARCMADLKAKGYRIAATSLHASPLPVQDIPLDKPLALVFGQEHIGISEIVQQQADLTLMIPMVGFTESLNISVAAGILLQQLSHRIRLQDKSLWQISEEEKDELRKNWTLRNLYRNELLIKRFYEDQQSSA